MLVAISLEFARITISKLKTVLFFFYFFILFVLFFVSRFLAGRSIVPVQNLTRGISKITKENLNERIPLPEKKDEIYDLSHSFNELLERIEQAVEREKQFTSDASHELRTPLASIKGQLEVLIRKPRPQEEYEDRIRLGLAEIDKMGFILEQLLLLARLDSHKVDEKKQIALPALIDESLSQFKNAIQNKGLRIELNCNPDASSLAPQYYSKLIVDNILSNAIKYSPKNSTIKISVEELDGRIICTIEDSGIGIRDQDLRSIFENFFRSAPLDHKQIQGFGLGLSIVKKSAEAIGATIEVSSALGEGTTFRITF
jgi:signal transduction histidine kinase